MRRLFYALTALALATLACGPSLPNVNLPIAQITPGPLQTVTVSEASAGDAVGQVTLGVGAGNLKLAAGGDGLVSGTIEYNVAEWKPEIKRDGAAVTIQQNFAKDKLNIPTGGGLTNKWDLKLGSGPLELTVNAGAYDGQSDLGGLRLRRLEINDGASTSTVTFDTANPDEMTLLKYATGASTVKLTGLANANFAEMLFDGGAGTYTLDFSGTLKRDARVTVRAGVCTLTIVVPPGTQAEVTKSGAITTVKTEGTWNTSGDTYKLSGSGPLLKISVDMGVGTLNLVSK